MAKYSNGSRDDLDLSESSIKVLEKRYLIKDDSGKIIETFDGLLKRVSNNIALADKIYDSNANIDKTAEKFYYMMSNLLFLPNSPTLMNAGRPLQQLSACFVLPIGDSMEEIFDAVKYTALIHKSGGGTGFSFSRLRPKGDNVYSTSSHSSGPIEFMRVFNAATEAVKQGGKRRGANMGIMRIDHPDILDFISCKEKEGELANFNISIALTDYFMEKMEKGEEYELINPHTGKVARKLKAREVFDKIANYAWRNGEPGIVFIDRINKYNPTPEIGAIESTNPCGEQPLLPYESCNLGSINLGKFVKNKNIDYDSLDDIVQESVHFLDNVIDMNKYPLPAIEKITKSNRKIGLGVMGFADMMIQLGIPYSSEESLKKAEEIMNFIKERAEVKDYSLAETRGAFPNFDKSVYKGAKPRRNATITTIAPTGTIAVIANSASSGVEPLYDIAYLRNVEDTMDTNLIETNPIFEKIARENGFWSKDLIKIIKDKNGQHIEINYDKIPKEFKGLFVTAHEVSYEHHIKIQAAFQKFTDNAVSKTINLKESATVEEVKDSYFLAYRLGCKGLTIYRDKSRQKQLLSTSNLEGKIIDIKETMKRPETLPGETKKMRVGCGKLYVTKNIQDGKFREVFTCCDFQGSCPRVHSDALNKVISLAAQHGIPPEEIGKSLLGGKCDKIVANKYRNVSCPDAIGKVLMNWIPKEDREKKDKAESLEEKANETNGNTSEDSSLSLDLCPECKIYALKHEEGCDVCVECGYSHCG